MMEPKNLLSMTDVIKKKARGAGEITTENISGDVSAPASAEAFKRTAEMADKQAEGERNRLGKLLYPGWHNLDSGQIALFKTDNPEWIKLQIMNKDYPGVCILKVSTLLNGIVNFKQELEVEPVECSDNTKEGKEGEIGETTGEIND